LGIIVSLNYLGQYPGSKYTREMKRKGKVIPLQARCGPQGRYVQE